MGILKLEEPDEKSSKLDKITTLNEEIKKAEEKFLKADDNLDKSFWSEKVQRLTKQLEKEEQLRLTKENEWLTGIFSLLRFAL